MGGVARIPWRRPEAEARSKAAPRRRAVRRGRAGRVERRRRRPERLQGRARAKRVACAWALADGRMSDALAHRRAAATASTDRSRSRRTAVHRDPPCRASPMRSPSAARSQAAGSSAHRRRHARAMPGVVEFMTYRNAPRVHSAAKTGANDSHAVSFPRRRASILRSSAVAVVIAETFEQATHARRLVRVEYHAARAGNPISTAGTRFMPERSSVSHADIARGLREAFARQRCS